MEKGQTRIKRTNDQQGQKQIKTTKGNKRNKTQTRRAINAKR